MDLRIEKERAPKYEIREAIADDVETIRRMQAQSWRDTYQNDELGVTKEWLDERTANWLTPERLEESRQKLGECFADRTQFYRVALADGEIVGFIHLETEADGKKYLWGLYTDKTTHGSGLAHEMMDLADEWIGNNEVYLKVVDYNQRARAFYYKRGFVEVSGSESFHAEIMPVIKMERKGLNQ